MSPQADPAAAPMNHKKLVGRDLIRLLAPLLDIEAENRVAHITLDIPFNDLVTATVIFHADTRLLELDWQGLQVSEQTGDPTSEPRGTQGKDKRGSRR